MGSIVYMMQMAFCVWELKVHSISSLKQELGKKLEQSCKEHRMIVLVKLPPTDQNFPNFCWIEESYSKYLICLSFNLSRMFIRIKYIDKVLTGKLWEKKTLHALVGIFYCNFVSLLQRNVGRNKKNIAIVFYCFYSKFIFF